MAFNLKVLWSYRELILTLMVREIKVRYKQTWLGVGWAILQPLVLMLVFTVVFTKFVRLAPDSVPYPLFSYAALLPWTFFASSLSFAIPSIVNNINLVTKIYFPREIIPLAVVGASLVDFIIASLLFVGMIYLYGLTIKLTALGILLVVGIQFFLTLGLAFLGASLNVFFRDLRFLVPIALQILMFLSPVIYSLDMVSSKFKYLLSLNPLTGIIESYRSLLLYGRLPNLFCFAISLIMSVTIFVVSYRFLKAHEFKFADLI
ncbi:MAG: ABC transporter permease [Calditrichaeota bacterium]|nr:MAG: ABC transporter permease [Calditrichota bacterium]